MFYMLSRLACSLDAFYMIYDVIHDAISVMTCYDVMMYDVTCTTMLLLLDFTYVTMVMM
jgi:hypothetical protein